MDVADFFTRYGDRGITAIVLALLLWFLKRTVDAMDKIPGAIEKTGQTHQGEVKAIVHSHREEVHSIMEAHERAMNEQGERFDRAIALFAKRVDREVVE